MNATLWRPIFTLAIFSLLPFAAFLAENREETSFDLDLLLYALVLLVPGLVALALARRLRGPRAGERVAVVFAVGLFLFFQYQLIGDLAELIGISSLGDWVDVAVWLAFFAGAIVLATRVSKHSLSWNYLLVAGALLLALPVAQYVNFKATEPAPASIQSSAGGPSFEGEPPEDRPNVYYLLLDGYGNAEEIEAATGYDISPFTERLSERGFVVHDDTIANYPVTYLSLASTLAMEYPLGSGPIGDHGPYYDELSGDNAVVRAFHELGYRFIHASDWTTLECSEKADVCLRPSKGTIEGIGGERERAILEATPLTTVLPTLDIEIHALSGYLSPDEVGRKVEAERGKRPIFALAHIIAPHPPFRYGPGCELRDAREVGSLEEWGKAGGVGGEEYARAIDCLNPEVLSMIDRIEARDPDAIVVVAGDHGPRFGFDFERPESQWTRPQFAQRFGMLNAQRLPEHCRSSAPEAAAPVNTFRIILACITGRELKLLPAKHYLVDQNENELERVDEGLLP